MDQNGRQYVILRIDINEDEMTSSLATEFLKTRS